MTDAEKRKYYMSAEYRDEMENMLVDEFWFMKDDDDGKCFPMEWSNGWLEEFYELCRQLKTEVSDDFRWTQLKEKFGTARCYYWGHITPYGQELISDFEDNITAHICEICGAEGELRNTGWIVCLCDECMKEIDDRHKEYDKQE